MRVLRWISGPALALLVVSCASTNQPRLVHFHEEEATDVIVRFSSWDLISITKPDTREGAYLPIFRRADAEQVLSRRDIPRGLAAVVCGFTYNAQQEAEQQAIWASIFGGLGYQRLVFLRPAWDHRKINGSILVRELLLNPGLAAGG